MSAPSISNWWRVLGGGLLASLLMHWVVFDLMRAAAWLPSMPAVAALRVNLKLPEPDISSVSPEPRPLTGSSTRQQQQARVRSSQDTTPDSPVREFPQTSPVGSATHVEGLRSGQAVEAKVALRLALAQSLGQLQDSQIAGALSRSLALWCDFDVNGRLMAIRSEAGAANAVIQIWVRRAVANVVMPDVLVGQAFSIDILLESDHE